MGLSAFSISEIADKLTVTGYHDSMPGAGTFKKEGNSYAFVAGEDIIFRHFEGAGAVAASSLSKLQREAGPAATRCLRLRIVHLERCADKIINEIDLRTGHVIDRDRIDQDHCAIAADDEIVSCPGAIHVKLVLKAGAATALNAHSQHRASWLTFEDVADPPRCPFADRDTRAHSFPFQADPIGR